MKKILTLFLVLCLLFQTVTTMASSIISENIDEANKSKLISLMDPNTVQNTEQVQVATTEDKYSKLLLKLGILQDETASDLTALAVFTSAYSLTKQNYGVSYIEGLIAKNGYTKEQKLNYKETLRVVLNALNYEGLAKLKGGYPNGYLFLASELRLTFNVNIQNFTANDYHNLLLNALKTNSNTLIMGYGNWFVSSKSKTILEDYYNTVVYEGTVNASFKKSISQTMVEKDELMLDDYIVKNGGYDFAPLVGSKISSYIQNDDKPVILWFEVLNKEPLKIDLSKIDGKSISQTSLKYENEEGKLVTIKLEMPAIIYNERSNLVFNENKIKPFYKGIKGKVYLEGEARFIDGDNNGKYDVIDVKAYENKVVANLAKLKFEYKDYYEDLLSINKYYYYANYDQATAKTIIPVAEEVIFVKDGKVVESSVLKNEDVLNIYSSNETKEGSTKTIAITSKSISGKVVKTTEEKVKIGDAEYEYSNYFLDLIGAQTGISLMQPGDDVTIYLNVSGKIVKYTKTKDNKLTYGLMVDYSSDNAFGDGKIKVLATDGTYKIFEFEQILYNNTMKSASDVLIALGKIFERNAPVSYKVSKNGKLSELNVEKYVDPIDVAYDGNGGFTLKSISSELKNYMGNLFKVSSKGAIMAVGFKTDKTIDLDMTKVIKNTELGIRPEYSTGNVDRYRNLIKFVGVDNTNKTVELAIVDVLPKSEGQDYRVPILQGDDCFSITDEFTPTYIGGKYKRQMFLAQNVSKGLNADGQNCYVVTGIQDGNPATYVFSNEVEYFGAPNTYPGHPATGLIQYKPDRAQLMSQRFQDANNIAPQIGDIAFVVCNSSGEVVEYKIAANVNEKPDRLYRERPFGTFMQWGYEYSYIKNSSDTTFMIGDYDINGTAYDWANPKTGEHQKLAIPAYKWNFEKQIFEKIDIADVYASDITLDGIAVAQKGDKVPNNVWIFVNKAHFSATEYIVVDFEEK